MTTERKISLLKNVKNLLPTHYKQHGICTLFFICCTEKETDGTYVVGSCATHYLGKTLTRHKPKHIEDNSAYWWTKDEQGLKIRLSKCDEMILELKTQL